MSVRTRLIESYGVSEDKVSFLVNKTKQEVEELSNHYDVYIDNDAINLVVEAMLERIIEIGTELDDETVSSFFNKIIEDFEQGRGSSNVSLVIASVARENEQLYRLTGAFLQSKYEGS